MSAINPMTQPAAGAPAAPAAAPAAAAGASTGQGASLYVGDLLPEVSESNLYDIFSAVGPVASIRVCRDSTTRRSLGYAYVNFHNQSDAERTIDTLNFTQIKGKPCRIMWCHRDPALRKNMTESNIFIKNLDKSVDNKQLHDTFSLFGNILSCKIATDARGKSLGYGFVHFEKEEAAKDAIEKMNDVEIGSKKVLVCKFQKRTDREAMLKAENEGSKKFTNIYAKHFSAEWDEEKLTQIFEQYGPVTSLYMTNDAKGRPYCFCNFEKPEDAERAVDELNGKDFRSAEEIEEQKEKANARREERMAEAKTDEDKESIEKSLKETEEFEDFLSKFYVVRAQSKTERAFELREKFAKTGDANGVAPTSGKYQGVNLYIKNLDDKIDDEGLRGLFKEIGTILSCKVMRDEKGNSKGFGFVSFANPDEATKAVTEMHLKLVLGKPLYVGLHERKEQRIERLQNRFRAPEAMMGGGMMGGRGMGMYGAGGNPGMYYPGGQMMNRGPMGAYPPNPAMRMNPAAQAPGMRQQGYPNPPMNPQQAAMLRQQQQMQAAQRQQQMAQMAQQQQQRAAAAAAAARQQQPGQQMPQQQAQPGQPPRSDAPLTAAALAAAPHHMQKQMLGEKLFPLISRIQPEYAGKITGMMLEMDNSEMLLLLESESQLRQKVNEAMRVLQSQN